jgi:GR25 family glycosyltransferase involved in LPS biosynthesis
MQHQFARHGIQSVQRFSALDGDTLETPANWTHSRGAYGCLLSHVEVVEAARRSGARSVLIFEDDTVFDPQLQDKFAVFIKEVPADWDMLYFGALHKDEPIMVAEHVGRITKANSTFAYALKNTIFDEFIDLNRRAERLLDWTSYVLQERFNCYCFMPNLAWVQAEYSDVQNRVERHWYLEQSLVLFGAQVDRLLSQTTIVIAHNADHGSRNLTFLKSYYEEYFAPLVEIVIVEQDSTTFNREDCFNTGIARADRHRNFVILSDSDIYLETLDIRANLRMCEEFDGATGFDELIELTPQQAEHVRETGITRGIDITKNPSSKNTSARFFNRRALEAAGGWREEASFTRLFQSPNHALRLPRQ